MTTGLKVALLAVVGGTTVSGLAGLGYVLAQPKNLKEDLEKGQYKLLDTESDKDNTHWQTLAEKHKGSQALPEGITKINGLNITDPTGQETHPGIQQLKDQCKKFFKKTKKDSDYFQTKTDATNWCTKKQIPNG